MEQFLIGWLNMAFGKIKITTFITACFWNYTVIDFFEQWGAKKMIFSCKGQKVLLSLLLKIEDHTKDHQ